jgi:hypothetical protein
MAKRRKKHVCTCEGWQKTSPVSWVTLLIQLYRLYTGQD